MKKASAREHREAVLRPAVFQANAFQRSAG